jgi:hypothetical protein
MKHLLSWQNIASTYKEVTGSVLYYARAVNPTFLIPLIDIATEQTKANEKTSDN